jgi:hypothetical protein
MASSRATYELQTLGLSWSEARALLVLPALQVAWSDQRLDPGERSVIHAFAEDTLLLDGTGLSVVDRWLRRSPGEAFVAAGLECLVTLVHAVDVRVPGLTPDTLRLAMDFAEVVAVEHPSGSGELRKTERNALTEVQAQVASITAQLGPQVAFEGRPVSPFWRRLLEELGTGLPGARPTAPVPPSLVP